MKRALQLRILLSAGLLLIVAGAFSACSTMNKITRGDVQNGKLFAVANDGANFYKYGPQQGNGPDEKLPRDTLLTLIRPSFGYCKVQLVSGAKEGYVASEDIKPAPPTLVAALTSPPPSATSTHENFNMQSSEPPPPETLPAPDLPPTDSPSPAPNP